MTGQTYKWDGTEKQEESWKEMMVVNGYKYGRMEVRELF
jgi:hypothetical protein